MAPYRDNARWGALVATHRGRGASWLVAGLLAIVAAIGCAYAVASTQDVDVKLAIGVFLFGGLAWWMLGEYRRLSRIAVQRFERGFTYFDGRTEHEVEWTDVTAVEAQYVPGVLERGSADPGNLVSLVLVIPKGAVSLPRELGGFAELRTALQKHVTAPWQDVTIASLYQRSGS
jgi:hypothetical protein